jgi:hypothetical protein
MSRVQDTLAAWREAERRLEATDDPREIPALLAEVKSHHEAYRRAVDLSGHDVSGHGERTETQASLIPNSRGNFPEVCPHGISLR